MLVHASIEEFIVWSLLYISTCKSLFYIFLLPAYQNSRTVLSEIHVVGGERLVRNFPLFLPPRHRGPATQHFPVLHLGWNTCPQVSSGRPFLPCMMMTEVFSQNIGRKFSKFKLVTANLPSHFRLGEKGQNRSHCLSTPMDLYYIFSFHMGCICILMS